MRTLHAIFPAAVVGCLLLTAPVAFADNGEDTKLNLGSAAEPAETAQGAGGGSIVRTIVGLAVVLAVIYGLYWVLKRVKSSKDSAASGSGLETLATMPLGTNRALHLVRAGREIVLIGTAENSVSPIRRYSEEEARALGLIDAPTMTAGATLESLAPVQRRGFMEILRSKTVVR
jgi:flagellar protein FliO/FliZ